MVKEKLEIQPAKLNIANEVYYRGVRKRPWGYYTPKIRDPGKKSPVWLGSFKPATGGNVEFVAQSYPSPVDVKTKMGSAASSDYDSSFVVDCQPKKAINLDLNLAPPYKD